MPVFPRPPLCALDFKFFTPKLYWPISRFSFQSSLCNCTPQPPRWPAMPTRQPKQSSSSPVWVWSKAMRARSNFLQLCLCRLPALLLMRDSSQHKQLTLVSKKRPWLDSHTCCTCLSLRAMYGLPDRCRSLYWIFLGNLDLSHHETCPMNPSSPRWPPCTVDSAS